MKSITIEGKLRTGSGKKDTRQVRSQGFVPGVIYGGAETISFYTELKTLKPLVYTAEFQIAEITIGGKKYRTILKDLQFGKVSDELIHIDLLELVEDKKVIATLPVRIVGTPEGVKAGGKLEVKVKSVKVKTLPKYLKEFLTLDVSNLELNTSMRVEDIPAENMEVLNSPRIPVVSITMTRQLKQEEAAAAKEAKKK